MSAAHFQVALPGSRRTSWGIVALWRLPRATTLPYFSAILLFPCGYYLFHVKPDFRQAIEPEITVLVTAGLLGRKLGANGQLTRARALAGGITQNYSKVLERTP